MTQHSQIFICMPLTNTGFILTESEVEHPMETVFHPPMAAHSLGKRLNRREAEQKIAGFSTDFLTKPTLRLDPTDAAQSLPALLWSKVAQQHWLTDGLILPDLQATMPFFHSAQGLDLSLCIFLCQRKGGNNLLTKVFVIVFEGQSIISPLFNNLFLL